MVMVNLPVEALDSIVQNTLIEDYRRVMEEIRTLLHREGDLKNHEREDLENNLDYKVGYENLLRYYLVHNAAVDLIDEENMKLYSADESDYDDLDDYEYWEEDEEIDQEYIKAVDEKTNILRQQLDALERKVDLHLSSHAGQHTTGSYHRPRVKIQVEDDSHNWG
jgi:hypothetical protein